MFVVVALVLVMHVGMVLVVVALMLVVLVAGIASVVLVVVALVLVVLVCVVFVFVTLVLIVPHKSPPFGLHVVRPSESVCRNPDTYQATLASVLIALKQPEFR